MKKKQNKNWLAEIITDLRSQQQEPKQICWTLSELHKDNRIPACDKAGLISQIQSLLEKEGITAEKIEPKFNQHNCYLDISLRNGKHIRIMDKKPFGEPVSSELILKPEKPLGTVKSGEHELRVGIYPATKTLAAALRNDEISIEDARKQIEGLEKKLAKDGLVLWDPWAQNFGVNEHGKIFVSFEGAVAKEKDISNKPFEPYSSKTIDELKVDGFANLDKMLTEAKSSKIAGEILSGRTHQTTKSKS
ncbi:MAG: hypothetical protein ABL867_01265 [Rickettsiales bacterium]